MNAHTRASPSVAGQVVPREGSEPAETAEPSPMFNHELRSRKATDRTESEHSDAATEVSQ